MTDHSDFCCGIHGTYGMCLMPVRPIEWIDMPPKKRVRLRSNPDLVGNYEGSKRAIKRAQKFIREREAERDRIEMAEKHLKIVPPIPDRKWQYHGMPLTFEMYSLFKERDDEMLKYGEDTQRHIRTIKDINLRLRAQAEKEGFDLSDVPEAKQ